MAYSPYKNLLDVFEPDLIMYYGLVAARLRIEDSTKYTCKIMSFGQEEFCKKSFNTDPQFRDHCRDLLDTVLFKFRSNALTIEQLHAIRNAKDYKISPESLAMVEGENHDEFLHRALFDSSLIEAQSFMEMYLRYVAFFCGKKKYTYSKTSNMLEDINKLNSKMGKEAYEYLISNVYRKNRRTDDKLWGDYLEDLRNTPVHEKQIILSTLGVINRLGISRDEITYQDQPIARFVQDIQNNIVYMLHSMFKILYGMDWDEAREKSKKG